MTWTEERAFEAYGSSDEDCADAWRSYCYMGDGLSQCESTIWAAMEEHELKYQEYMRNLKLAPVQDPNLEMHREMWPHPHYSHSIPQNAGTSNALQKPAPCMLNSAWNGEAFHPLDSSWLTSPPDVLSSTNDTETSSAKFLSLTCRSDQDTATIAFLWPEAMGSKASTPEAKITNPRDSEKLMYAEELRQKVERELEMALLDRAAACHSQGKVVNDGMPAALHEQQRAGPCLLGSPWNDRIQAQKDLHFHCKLGSVHGDRLVPPPPAHPPYFPLSPKLSSALPRGPPPAAVPTPALSSISPRTTSLVPASSETSGSAMLKTLAVLPSEDTDTQLDVLSGPTLTSLSHSSRTWLEPIDRSSSAERWLNDANPKGRWRQAQPKGLQTRDQEYDPDAQQTRKLPGEPHSGTSTMSGAQFLQLGMAVETAHHDKEDPSCVSSSPYTAELRLKVQMVLERALASNSKNSSCSRSLLSRENGGVPKSRKMHSSPGKSNTGGDNLGTWRPIAPKTFRQGSSDICGW